MHKFTKTKLINIKRKFFQKNFLFSRRDFHSSPFRNIRLKVGYEGIYSELEFDGEPIIEGILKTMREYLINNPTNKDNINPSDYPYDIVFDFHTIRDLNKSVEKYENDNHNTSKNLPISVDIYPTIAVKEKRLLNNWETILNKPVISVIGDFNTGKSYIMGKISGYKFPSQLKVTTKGLSIKLPSEDMRFTIIDTAGSAARSVVPGKSIPEEKRNQMWDKINDKRLVDHLLRELVIDVADVYCYFTNEMTNQDQLEINKIKKDHPGKMMFVVHNLINYQDMSTLRNYMEDVYKSYPNSRFDLPDLNVLEDLPATLDHKLAMNISSDDHDQIKHFFFINESASTYSLLQKENIGIIWNKLSTLRMKSCLDSTEVKSNTSLDGILNNLSKRIRESSLFKTRNETKFDLKFIPEKLDVDKVNKIYGQWTSSENSTLDPSQVDIKLGLVDDIPKIIFPYSLGEFVPNVTYRIDKDKSKFLFIVELPGVSAEDINIRKDYGFNEIKIWGEKKDNWREFDEYKNEQKSSFGEVRFSSFGTKDQPIKLKAPNGFMVFDMVSEFKDGILVLTLKPNEVVEVPPK